MPRDHALALEIQGELEKLEERRKQLMEDLAEADPAVAELTALNQQTCTIGDLDFLLKVDDGRVAREYRRVANRMINDIELNPFRVVDGKPKPETRKLAIIMEVTPVVTSSETGETWIPAMIEACNENNFRISYEWFGKNYVHACERKDLR